MQTSRIARASVVAALYATTTILLAPISFGPLQLRVANLLMALMFFDEDYCYGLALGIFIGNLASPFGPLDWLVMPAISLGGALAANRQGWPLGIATWALITAMGVAIFPLGFGAQLPVSATLFPVLAAQLVAGCLGYFMFRPFSKLLRTTSANPSQDRVAAAE